MGKRNLSRAAIVAVLTAAVAALSACGSTTSQDTNVVAGKKLFVSKCGACHVLARAGTKGTTGPNLDQAFQQSLAAGFGRTAVEGVVHKQILYPNRNGVMPAKLVEGEDALDVAAYVAKVVAKPGKDAGLLATAVPQAGAAKAAVEKNGVISIPADPGGQLAYVTNKAIGTPGPVTIEMPNKSGVPHNIAISGLGSGKVIPNGVSSFKATLAAGKTYTFFCEVPGHEAAGMKGTLTVK